jgi:hypothetical protein
MKPIIVIAACLGVLTEPFSARANPIYQECGPNGAGFIKVGGQITCISKEGATQVPQAGAGAKTGKTAQGGTNPNVDQTLNSADLAFREGDKNIACQWVGNAINWSTDHKGRNTASENQRQQLREYARRCNLRY